MATNIFHKNLAEYLEDEGHGTVGTNIFIGKIPSEAPNNCVIVYDTGGVAPDTYIPTRSPSAQIYVRNTSYETGKEKIEAIVSSLHKEANFSIQTGEQYVYYAKLMQEPSHIGQDENDRQEFSANFLFLYR